MDNDFSSRLNSLMRERGLTQMELAKLLKTGQSTISQWLAGTSSPRVKTIPRMALMLQVDAKWLAEGAQPLKSAVANETSQPAERWPDVLGQLSPEQAVFLTEAQIRLCKEEGRSLNADELSFVKSLLSAGRLKSDCSTRPATDAAR